MWPWRRSRLTLPEDKAEAQRDAGELGAALLGYGAGQLADAGAGLKAEIEGFYALPPERRQRELPRLYLAVEAALGEQLRGTGVARAELRRVIEARFRPLLDQPDFALIFAPAPQQEFVLCKRMLTAVVDEALKLLGSAGSDRLRLLRQWLDAAPEASLPVPLVAAQRLPRRESEWVTLFFQMARELYASLEKTLGPQCARSFYERSYREISDRYLQLETFPVVVSLLPEPLVDSTKIGRLSRGQIQRVLLQKVVELDGINAELHGKYEELEATRQSLATTHEQLEQRVHERTAALEESNEQLQHEIAERRKAEVDLRAAKELAEFANRAKSQFLANMSHELRTPLNAIIGFSDVMLRETFGPLGDARYREYLEDMSRSGAHLLDMINDLLDLAKAEAGKFDLVTETVVVREIVERAMPLVAAQAEASRIRLVNAVAADLPPIRVDPRRIVQVLLNLLSNAVKFTEAGGTVSVDGFCDGDGNLTISVTDTGIGIAPADVQRVLRPFEQVETGYSRRYQGTGLGLPLAVKLMELHGGTLTIESDVGKGTVARLVLPAVRVEERAAE
jgi:signal transduction histidine kinase